MAEKSTHDVETMDDVPNPMFKDDPTVFDFLQRLGELDIYDVFFQPENIDLLSSQKHSFISIDHFKSAVKMFKDYILYYEQRKESRNVLQGMDVGSVKHFGYDTVKVFTHVMYPECCIAKSSFGRFLCFWFSSVRKARRGGKVERIAVRGNGSSDIIIKDPLTEVEVNEFIPTGRPIIVSQGMTVQKGQPLTEIPNGDLLGLRKESKGFTIKTWDIHFPLGVISRNPVHRYHTARLSNEIKLLTDENFKTHRGLPDLVGYSIEKSLVVVYGFAARKTLLDALHEDEEELDWYFRFKVAIQVAELMAFFHKSGRTIGTIDAKNFLIDENYDIKLCEFGICAGSQGVGLDRMLGSGWYLSVAPDPYLVEDAGSYTFSPEIDVFAYGGLLVELMCSKFISRGDVCRSWYAKQMLEGCYAKSREGKIVITYFRQRIISLVFSCLDKNPQRRCNAASVVNELHELKKLLGLVCFRMDGRDQSRSDAMVATTKKAVLVDII